ncbi:hypothetical protein F5Y13DRAFT_187444 [Hypoxylon sp. FL1857]|nr:hypothetical protein F5Y13DRAFT_187444 [Hypoxylon sp. FL1857]
MSLPLVASELLLLATAYLQVLLSDSGVVDYIWYSTKTLDVVELLGPPDYDYPKRVPGIPDYHFPADHIQINSQRTFKYLAMQMAPDKGGKATKATSRTFNGYAMGVPGSLDNN